MYIYSPTGQIRLIQTTDLHMHLLGFDYWRDATTSTVGLLGLVPLLEHLRSDPTTLSLLFDTGDLLQGNQLADSLFATRAEWEQHPMIEALNQLAYDAITPGNHDFDYGIEFLNTCYSDTKFPVICSNLAASHEIQRITNATVLDRYVTLSDGSQRPIRIGVLGFLPPGTKLPGRGEDIADDIVECAHWMVPHLKQKGADIIIALCHSGIGQAKHLPRMENAALPLSQVPGIDAILMGHKHEVFPDKRISTDDTLNGVPAVMTEPCGQSLGVIDMSVAHQNGGWRVVDSKSRIVRRPGKPVDDTPRQSALKSIVEHHHHRARQRAARVLAYTQSPLQNFFATIAPDPVQALVARALRHGVQTLLKNRNPDDLPVLAATSPFQSGISKGQGTYIPPGPIRARDVEAFYPFNDHASALLINGAQLKLWLEQSASFYREIAPGLVDQTLNDDAFPPYNADTIHGITYRINLAHPAAFTPEGQRTGHPSERIAGLCFNGQPVTNAQSFVVATNSYRAAGGGGFFTLKAAKSLGNTDVSVQALIETYLKTAGSVDITPPQTWHFAPIKGATAKLTRPSLAAAFCPAYVIPQPSRPDGTTEYILDFGSLAAPRQSAYMTG